MVHFLSHKSRSKSAQHVNSNPGSPSNVQTHATNKETHQGCILAGKLFAYTGLHAHNLIHADATTTINLCDPTITCMNVIILKYTWLIDWCNKTCKNAPTSLGRHLNIYCQQLTFYHRFEKNQRLKLLRRCGNSFQRGISDPTNKQTNKKEGSQTRPLLIWLIAHQPTSWQWPFFNSPPPPQSQSDQKIWVLRGRRTPWCALLSTNVASYAQVGALHIHHPTIFQSKLNASTRRKRWHRR